MLPASKYAKHTEALFKLRAHGLLCFVVNDAYLKEYADENGAYKPPQDRILILYGGSGSGKSYFKGTELLIKCLTQPYCRVIFCRKFREQIRDSQFKLFKDLIRDYRLSEYFTVKEQDMDIRCKINDNELLSAGLDDVEKLMSIQGPTDIWIEEPVGKKGLIHFSDFTELNRRIRYPGVVNQMHLTFNPITKHSWVYKKLFAETHWTTHRLKTTYIDNNYLPDGEKEVYEALRTAAPEEYEIYGLGKWGDPNSELSLFTPNVIYDAFRNEFVKGGKRYMTVDPSLEGEDDMCMIIWDDMIVEKIIMIKKLNGRQLLEKIISVARENRIVGSNICFDATGIGGFLSGFLASSIPFHGSAAAIKEDEPKTEIQKKLQRKSGYLNLRAQCFFWLSGQFRDGKIAIRIKSSIEQGMIEEELLSIRKASDSEDKPLAIMKKDDIKKILGRSPNIADALSMRAVFSLQPAKTGVRRSFGGAY